MYLRKGSRQQRQYLFNKIKQLKDEGADIFDKFITFPKLRTTLLVDAPEDIVRHYYQLSQPNRGLSGYLNSISSELRKELGIRIKRRIKKRNGKAVREIMLETNIQ